ncbi:MAG TPA: chorismate synthase [Clostridiales bacterium]|nr:chorismate synthase [Clostridiales bacterium]
MSSNFGTNIKISIFGESHGQIIGAVIDGLPPGEEISIPQIQIQLSRRAPGCTPTSTTRKEKDEVEILTGFLNGKTTGAPLMLAIRNQDTRSANYENISVIPRPSHSDYAAYVKYKGNNDIRGGGHFSGRLTAPLVAAGSICRQILKRRGITIGGHVLQILNVKDPPFDPVNVSEDELQYLSEAYFSTRSKQAKEGMIAEILNAKQNLDSVGGVVEVAVTGLPTGVGSPMFGGIENVLSAAIFAVPAVKGVSFGAGFDYAKMYGSNANDEMYYDGDNVMTYTNNCGGITGGITNGMPLIIKAAIKPTPSIYMPQRSINLQTHENTTLKITGRHDPCIVPRALPAIEAAVAIALTDLMAEANML